jgi:hypothetical protein
MRPKTAKLIRVEEKYRIEKHYASVTERRCRNPELSRLGCEVAKAGPGMRSSPYWGGANLAGN